MRGWAVGALVVLAACSARSDGQTTISSTLEGGRPGSTASADPAVSGADGQDQPGPVPDRQPGEAPTGFRAADHPAPGGDLPLEFNIEPGCVEHGSTITFAARTGPGIYVAAQVLFPASDFERTPQKNGTTDKHGRLTWALRVEPDAGTGEAGLLASARDPDSSEPGTSGTWRFLVRPAGGCEARG